MRIALAQLNPVVGAFNTNFEFIKEAYERACQEQARLLLTSELVICGYPPLDWINRPELVEGCEKTLQKLATLTQGRKCALAVGHLQKNPSQQGRPPSKRRFRLRKRKSSV
jgi:predicted amidohydrolase